LKKRTFFQYLIILIFSFSFLQISEAGWLNKLNEMKNKISDSVKKTVKDAQTYDYELIVDNRCKCNVIIKVKVPKSKDKTITRHVPALTRKVFTESVRTSFGKTRLRVEGISYEKGGAEHGLGYEYLDVAKGGSLTFVAKGCVNCDDTASSSKPGRKKSGQYRNTGKSGRTKKGKPVDDFNF
jgi:hypothetical protein